MAPKANLLTTDEVAGVMKTAMEKPSGRPVVEPKWWTRLMAVVATSPRSWAAPG